MKKKLINEFYAIQADGRGCLCIKNDTKNKVITIDWLKDGEWIRSAVLDYRHIGKIDRLMLAGMKGVDYVD